MAPTFIIWMVLLCAPFIFASPLCTPAQWEGFLAVTASSFNGSSVRLIKELVAIHYDATNNRLAQLHTIVRGDEDKYQVLVVTQYKDKIGKEYVVDLKKGTCEVDMLHGPFDPICLSPDAKLVGNISLGLGGHFNVSLYKYTVKQAAIEIATTSQGSNVIPVNVQSVESEKGHVSLFSERRFFNVTLGIKSPTVFDIPPVCQKVNYFRLPRQLTRFSAVTGFNW